MKRNRPLKFLSMSEVCGRLGGISERTLYRRISDQIIPQPVLLGGLNVFVESEIDEAMERIAARSRNGRKVK